MWIRLFSFVSVVLFGLISNTIAAQISIYSKSEDNHLKRKSGLAQIDQLQISEKDVLQFHDISQKQLITEFLLNDKVLWDLDLTRLTEVSPDLDIQLLINPDSSISQSGVKISRYKGSLIGSKHSSVYLTIVENKFDLVIQDSQKYYTISWSEEKNSYVYQEDDKHTKSNLDLKCNTASHMHQVIDSNQLKQLKSTNSTCHEINLQFYTDHLFYKEYNQSIELGLLKIMSTVTQIQEDYTQFNIHFNVNAIQFSACQACDPWTNSQDPSNLLNDFKLKTDPVEDNSIKILLTGRSLDNLFVGIATYDSFCTSYSKAVIQDISYSTWQQRVILSHEIGHILGSSHDDSMNNIMSSSLTNTSTWTSSTNSIIQYKISNSSCLTGCSTFDCPQITDIKITAKASDEITLEWTATSSTSIYYELIHLESGELKSTGISHSQIQATDLSGCEEYELILYVSCGNGKTNEYTKIISTASDQTIDINQIDVVNCTQDYVDLKLFLSHNLVSDQYISVTIGNEERQFNITPYTFSILITSINNYGRKDELITLSAVEADNNLCLHKRIYDMPENDCSIKWEENFEQSSLPDFWSLENSNTDFFVSPYSWKVDDSNRDIANYDYGYHETNGTTLNGSNMMYMDDDYLAFNSYTGTTSLLSPKWDLSQYTDIAVSFEYIFHRFIEKGDNESYFTIDVWSGSEWIQVFDADQTSCPWFKIWENNCSNVAQIDLSIYNHHSFQLRFVYSDGDDSKWTGMAAFDNFKLEANNPRLGCIDIEALNYDIQADIHDQERCLYECSKDLVLINAYPTNYNINNVNKIEATGTVSQSDVNLVAQTFVELTQGFSIELGSTILLDTEQCAH